MAIAVIGAGGIGEAIGGIQVSREMCDVRHFSEVNQILSEIRPDVMVFTAGVSYTGSIKESGIVQLREELEVNLIGAFNVAKACVLNDVKTMIFIASVAGLYGKPEHSGYSASKAGVISLVQSLAMEGHDAYAISPGRVDTKLRERDYPNDTPGSRLEPKVIAGIVSSITNGKYDPGDNIIVRKIGLDVVVKKVAETPWKNELAVGQPVTI